MYVYIWSAINFNFIIELSLLYHVTATSCKVVVQFYFLYDELRQGQMGYK